MTNHKHLDSLDHNVCEKCNSPFELLKRAYQAFEASPYKLENGKDIFLSRYS